MQTQMDRIEWKLDQIMAALVKESSSPAAMEEGSSTPLATGRGHHVEMPQFTTKQHAALQMLLRGADNNEIAERFNVSPNTSKVYVRSIAKKLDVQTRAQIVVKLLDAFNDFDDNSYRMLTGGLPKDWDQNYAEPDPFAHLYRVERGEDDT
jgi:DNA-binding NarL/FixJ family response regulator